MNNILMFPKEVLMKQGMQQKLRDQKTHLMLSIAAVLVVSVMSNEFLSRGSGSANLASQAAQGRGIASVGGVAALDSKKQVQWEQEVVKDLSEKPANGVLANKPTLRDEMVFGFLEGKYGVKTANGKIRSLEFLQMQGTEQAMSIPDRAAFLKHFKEAFAVNFEKVGMAEAGADNEKYKLIDAQNNILGEAVFKMNAQGQVMSLEVIKQ